MADRTFFPFCTSHLVVLVLTALVLAVMIGLRRKGSSWAGLAECGLTMALLLFWPVSSLARYLTGELNLQNALPFHLCDVAAFAGAIALLKRDQLAAELVYFFGLAGTLNGLITPALLQDFPHLTFFAFFLGHSGIVIAAVHVVAGMRLVPRPGALGRMLGCILSYAAVVGAINGLLGTNYGFVCWKAPSPSLMDVLGPWPWYVGSLVLLSLVFFVALDLPFVIQRWRKKDLALPRQSA
jgi:hypothetical integral membrane protein (TIGR02206 family)